MKSHATVEKVFRELSSGEHMVVQYMGEWAKDYRQFVYSKQLKSSVRLFSAYEMSE